MSNKWYHELCSDPAPALVMRLSKIKEQNSQMRTKWKLFSDLYLNVDSGFTSNDEIGVLTGREGSGGLESNMIMRCVDSIVTMLILNISRARFVTDDANDILKTKAVHLTNYCDTIDADQRFPTMAEKVLRDGCLYGKGWVKVWPDYEEKKVKVKPVPAGEIHVSVLSGINNKPDELLHRYVMSRDEAIGRWPEHEDSIAALMSTIYNGHVDDDAIEVIEGFRHEPWKKGKETGRHVVVLGGSVVVLDEKWPYEVPFVAFTYKHHMASFWGTGIPDVIVAKQLYINTILKDSALACHRYGHAKLFVHTGTTFSKDGQTVTKEALTDEIGSIMEYTGDKPPTWSVPNSLTSTELQNMYHNLMQQCHDDVGINELASGGKVPTSIRSGKGISEANDVQSRRFASVQTNWDQFSIDKAKAYFNCGKRLYKKNSKLAIKSHNGSLEMIWQDLDLDESAYEIHATSVSSLPISAQGRLDYIEDAQNLGFIGKEQAFELLGSLDVQSMNADESASRRAAQRYARLALEGKMQVPDEFMSLEECLKIATSMYNQLMGRDDSDPEQVTNLKEYMAVIKREMKPTPQPTMPPQGPAEMGQMIPPAPPSGPPQGNVALEMPPGALPAGGMN